MKKIITLFLLLALFTSCASPAVSNTLPQSTEPITEQTKSEEQNTTDKDFVYVDYAQANRFVVFSDILLEKIKQVYSSGMQTVLRTEILRLLSKNYRLFRISSKICILGLKSSVKL